MGVRIRSLDLKAEHETTYMSSVRHFLDGSIQRTLRSIAVRKTMRTSFDILTHAYSATGDGPHSKRRGSLHSIEVSAGLFCVMLKIKVPASCLIKSNGRLIVGGPNVKIGIYSKAAE